MTAEDITHAVAEYAHSARLAIEAGFDGVELHAANGYLIEQFLNANVHRRTDAYGDAPDGRNRFALEVMRATVIPNLARFPRIGRRYLDNPPQSAEALGQLASLPTGTAGALREYLHGDYLLLYASMDAEATVFTFQATVSRRPAARVSRAGRLRRHGPA
jgi:hypothetical protein